LKLNLKIEIGLSMALRQRNVFKFIAQWNGNLYPFGYDNDLMTSSLNETV
jgi:hypothetical protein